MQQRNIIFGVVFVIILGTVAFGYLGKQLFHSPAIADASLPVASQPATSAPAPRAAAELATPTLRQTLLPTVKFAATIVNQTPQAATPPVTSQTITPPDEPANTPTPAESAASQPRDAHVESPPPTPVAATDQPSTPDLPSVSAAESSSFNRAPLPMRLTIPALGIDAPIVSVGLDRDGNMAAPATADVAGWYNLGPRPGEPSNAIIAGHVDWMGAAGVFAQLHTLQPGDIIEVRSQAGANFQYVVESLQTYQNDTAPVAEIFGGTAEPILTLITCTGPFDARRAEYRDRLVIRATAKLE